MSGVVARVPSFALALGMGLASAPSARAQFSEAQPGARIRVEAPGVVAGRYEGTVLTREGATMRIGATNASSVDVPLDRITSLEVSRGKSRSAGAWRGVAWGLPIGLAVGALTATTIRSCTGTTCRDPDAAEKSAYVLGSTLGGAFWGGVIGALVGRERWEKFEAPVRSGVDLRHRNAQVALRITY